LVIVRLLMVPLATVMVTGAVGEMVSPPNAGEAVTVATGAGAALEEVVALDEPLVAAPPAELGPATVDPATWVRVAADVLPEHAATATSSPPRPSVNAIRRAAGSR
jgi:hypothetical protein